MYVHLYSSVHDDSVAKKMKDPRQEGQKNINIVVKRRNNKINNDMKIKA